MFLIFTQFQMILDQIQYNLSFNFSVYYQKNCSKIENAPHPSTVHSLFYEESSPSSIVSRVQQL